VIHIPMAMIIDYGVGNILSLKCALEKVGFKVTTSSSFFKLELADTIILPGVGNFSTAIRNIESLKTQIINIIKKEIPVLGICLGMQLYFSTSEEGEGIGLTLFQGKNIRLPNSVKVPHIGWNTLKIIRPNSFTDGLDNNSYVYFVHSCYPIPENEKIICAQTTYGVEFTSIIADKNIYGTQFHPEKSGKTGLNILRNFLDLVKR